MWRVNYTDDCGRMHSEPASDVLDAAMKAAKRTTDPGCHDVTVTEHGRDRN